MSDFSNILLIQLGDIGDVVLTTPTVRAVFESYPEARISILVRKPFGSLLMADPSLHEVVETEKITGASLPSLRKHFLFARYLRQKRYDLVVDLRTSDRGAIYAFSTGAKVRVGRLADNQPFWYKIFFTTLLSDPPYAKQPVHPGADQSLRIVRAIGINTYDSGPRLYVSAQNLAHSANLLNECGLTQTSRWVTINPCSRWKYKEWEYAKWGKIIDLLWQEHQLATVLIGSPEEAETAGDIVAGRNDHAFNLAGKTTLGELSALISLSSLHLGVDSAAPHIAAATGIPTLTIFGPGTGIAGLSPMICIELSQLKCHVSHVIKWVAMILRKVSA